VPNPNLTVPNPNHTVPNSNHKVSKHNRTWKNHNKTRANYSVIMWQTIVVLGQYSNMLFILNSINTNNTTILHWTNLIKNTSSSNLAAMLKSCKKYLFNVFLKPFFVGHVNEAVGNHTVALMFPQ